MPLMDKVRSKLKRQSDVQPNTRVQMSPPMQMPPQQPPPMPFVPMPDISNSGHADGTFELDAQSRAWAAERAQYLQQENQRRHLAANNAAQQRDAQQRAAAEEQHRKMAQDRGMKQVKEQEEANKRILERQRNASAESVRRLRELVREKYRLDVYVWSKRDVLRANQKIIMGDCKKADAILQEIYYIINAWEEDLFDAEEWKVAKKIKESLSQTDQHAIWVSQPPWDREEL